MGRSDIIDLIKKQLPDYDFKDNKFRLNTIQHAPSQEVLINNQRYVRQGRSITITKLIEIRGDGYIQDDNAIREFTQVYFAVFVNGEVQQDIEICCLWDDADDLLNIIENFK